MKRSILTAALCALIIPLSAVAQVQGNTQPQGFSLNTLTSLEEVKQQGYDDQLVVLRGRFTRQVTDDKYEFTDEKGNTITAELDDDQDWSHVAKDALVEILAEVDRKDYRVELEVLQAKPVR